MLMSVEESLLNQEKTTSAEPVELRMRVIVVPYIHTSYNHKKVGQRAGIDVVFLAPYKLLHLAGR